MNGKRIKAVKRDFDIHGGFFLPLHLMHEQFKRQLQTYKSIYQNAEAVHLHVVTTYHSQQNKQQKYVNQIGPRPL